MHTEVRGIRISSPARIVYPELDLTKLDLVHYYDRVAEAMLPHVKERPLTLVHCPEGVPSHDATPASRGTRPAPCNYMRHRRVWGPSVLKRVTIKEKTKTGEYLAVVNVEGIIALAQMGIVEVHTWNSTIDDVERPNRIVWDLDPGPQVAFMDVIAGAIAVRKMLETLGLETWVKTTGGHGIHVVAPLQPERKWDECLAFSKAVAEALARSHPLYTTKFAKAGREKKILIDYLRNNRTNTSVAALSARARPSAAVSMPVSWRQLTAKLNPQAFTVLTAPKTLRTDPWRDYWSCRQKISAAAFTAIGKLRGIAWRE
jgi:bifunctional non-homologous end joining protein LigD